MGVGVWLQKMVVHVEKVEGDSTVRLFNRYNIAGRVRMERQLLTMTRENSSGKVENQVYTPVKFAHANTLIPICGIEQIDAPNAGKRIA